MNQMIKVVHLQTHLPTSGNAAFRLHQALNRSGVHSTMLSLTTDVGASAKVDHLNLKASVVARFNSKFHNRHNTKVIEKFGLFSYPVLGNDVSKQTITGGCHHSFTCTKYAESCNHCQMFENAKKNGLPSKELNKKHRLYHKYNNLHFVSPSKWLYELAKKSVLTKDKPVFHIPNLVDTTIFKPADKRTLALVPFRQKALTKAGHI